MTSNAIPPSLRVSPASFEATHRPGSPEVLLRWRTASELNNYGFGIERSLNGCAWTRLTFVASLSSTTSRAQDYVHASAYVGAAYYRLRQQDLNGAATYSPISYVPDASTLAPLAVYPNPTTGGFTVVGADLNQPLEIYDILGHRVLLLPPGVRVGTFGTLPGGVYVLRQGTVYTRILRK